MTGFATGRVPAGDVIRGVGAVVVRQVATDAVAGNAPVIEHRTQPGRSGVASLAICGEIHRGVIRILCPVVIGEVATHAVIGYA